MLISLVNLITDRTEQTDEMRLLLRISIVMGILVIIITPARNPPMKRGLISTGNSNAYSINAEQHNAYGRTRKKKPQQSLFWPNQPRNRKKSNKKGAGSSEDDSDENDENNSDDFDIIEQLTPNYSSKKKTKYRSRESAEFEEFRLLKKPGIKRAASIRKKNQHFEGSKEMMRQYFMNTTSFVHGDTFLGLGRTTSGILFGYFATMYFIYILSTTLLLFQRRKDPSLSKFPLLISHFFPAAINGLIVILGFLRHMFRARYPCFIVLWTYGLLTPMYVLMIFEARSLNLIFEYHWNKRMQALLQASEPRSLEGDLSVAPIIVLDKSTKKNDHQKLTNNEDWLWIKKNGMAATIFGIFTFQFLMILTIQILSPYYTIWPKMMVYRCAGTLETILPILALLMYMFVIPLYLFIQLKRINDSYGVRKDIYSAVTQSAWIVLLFSIFRHVFFIEKFIGYVPTGFAVLVTFGILHYHTVCAPLLRIYVWQWSRSRVKKRMRKYLVLKRKIEAYIFPRYLRIRIDKKKIEKLVDSNDSTTGLKAPEPIKAGKTGEIRQRPRVKHSRNPEVTPTNCSPVDSRLDEASSPAASMSPMLPPELKPPTFNQVLQDEILCELFERYTLLEFSRENLLFYRAVCSLRSTYAALPHGAAQIFLVEKSRSLASQFIQINSPAEINIPGPVRKRIESRLAELDVDLTLFDEAQREVFRLMQNWSYPRFLRTLPEAEIRRFNKKARRNSTNGPIDNNLTSFSSLNNNQLNSISSALTISNNIQNNSQSRTRAEIMATSVCSLTLPMNIADVSLSSSP